MNSQIERYSEQGLEDPEQRSFCTHGIGVHSSQHMDEFTNIETLKTPLFSVSMEASLHRHD